MFSVTDFVPSRYRFLLCPTEQLLLVHCFKDLSYALHYRLVPRPTLQIFFVPYVTDFSYTTLYSLSIRPTIRCFPMSYVVDSSYTDFSYKIFSVPCVTDLPRTLHHRSFLCLDYSYHFFLRPTSQILPAPHDTDATCPLCCRFHLCPTIRTFLPSSCALGCRFRLCPTIYNFFQLYVWDHFYAPCQHLCPTLQIFLAPWV